ncbi:heparan-alpha-glucosaminide N-acetyltransferase [Roseibium aggregatum]|uniref:heparan-alpha-glucosaminide N-acetyltransferase n=1 Tax=Roseibium aggregatum TaxID=187304 RepID=UPI003A985BBA
MRSTRLAVLDLARGLAVVAMAIYHFSWDLSWFAYVDWPVAQGTGWRIFAASIAGSFLFLAGISLDFAHHTGIRWQAFWRRLGVIVAAAAAVSAVTYFTFGDTFVRFGILHSIALSSLIALPFTRLPVVFAVLAAALVFSLPFWAASPAFDGQVWLWTGLGTPGFASVDYVPLAPWASVTLAGIAVSKIFRKLGLWQSLSGLTFSHRPGRLTRFLGRHSLLVYLLHQPLLYGLVWTAAQVGPEMDRSAIAFVRNCTASCQGTTATPDICQAACGCTLDYLKADGIWDKLLAEPENQSLRNQMSNRYSQCLADPEWQAPVN